MSYVKASTANPLGMRPRFSRLNGLQGLGHSISYPRHVQSPGLGHAISYRRKNLSGFDPRVRYLFGLGDTRPGRPDKPVGYMKSDAMYAAENNFAPAYARLQILLVSHPNEQVTKDAATQVMALAQAVATLEDNAPADANGTPGGKVTPQVVSDFIANPPVFTPGGATIPPPSPSTTAPSVTFDPQTGLFTQTTPSTATPTTTTPGLYYNPATGTYTTTPPAAASAAPATNPISDWFNSDANSSWITGIPNKYLALGAGGMVLFSILRKK